jgi:hypothetical protein
MPAQEFTSSLSIYESQIYPMLILAAARFALHRPMQMHSATDRRESCAHLRRDGGSKLSVRLRIFRRPGSRRRSHRPVSKVTAPDSTFLPWPQESWLRSYDGLGSQVWLSSIVTFKRTNQPTRCGGIFGGIPNTRTLKAIGGRGIPGDVQVSADPPFNPTSAIIITTKTGE